MIDGDCRMANTTSNQTPIDQQVGNLSAGPNAARAGTNVSISLNKELDPEFIYATAAAEAFIPDIRDRGCELPIQVEVPNDPTNARLRIFEAAGFQPTNIRPRVVGYVVLEHVLAEPEQSPIS